MKVAINKCWIEDFVSILKWDIENFDYSDFEKNTVKQIIDRMILEIGSEQPEINAESLYYLDNAVQRVISYSSECEEIGKEKAREYSRIISKLRNKMNNKE